MPAPKALRRGGLPPACPALRRALESVGAGQFVLGSHFPQAMWGLAGTVRATERLDVPAFPHDPRMAGAPPREGPER